MNSLREFQIPRDWTIKYSMLLPMRTVDVGDFRTEQYKETQLWRHTLFVLGVPDQPGSLSVSDRKSVGRADHPLILLGGAIKEPRVIDTYASQIDIAATLLAQLGLPHDDFTFSKNILNPSSPHFGYFTRPNFFGMVTPENQLVYNHGCKCRTT